MSDGQNLYGTDPGSEYTDDEVEFLRAIDEYMTATGRRFPAYTEVLAVAKSLGWRKVAEADGSLRSPPGRHPRDLVVPHLRVAAAGTAAAGLAGVDPAVQVQAAKESQPEGQAGRHVKSSM